MPDVQEEQDEQLLLDLTSHPCFSSCVTKRPESQHSALSGLRSMRDWTIIFGAENFRPFKTRANSSWTTYLPQHDIQKSSGRNRVLYDISYSGLRLGLRHPKQLF